MTIPTDGRIDLDALAELAKRATPGPWYTAGPPWFQTGSGVLAGSPDPHAGYLIVDTEMWAGERDEYVENNPNGVPLADADADAAFIAALDPTTVLTLIDLARRAAIPSEQGEAVWRTDWQNAPRDGTPVRLRYKGRNDETTLAWSTNYSVYGLGGCWSDGLCTMGDLDFAGWLPAHPAPAAGVKVKALEWRIEEMEPASSAVTWWVAVCPTTNLGYEVRITNHGKTRMRRIGQDWSDFVGSADDAKAAAQADYEARILSALDQGEPK